MKYTNVAIAVLTALTLSGCALFKDPEVITEVRVVEVPKPLPFCPAPPQVSPAPPNGFMVDKLTDEDINDPGLIAQSYKHDMIFLRDMIDVYHQIVQQYLSTSQDFDKTNDLINELFTKMKGELARQNEAAAKRRAEAINTP